MQMIKNLKSKLSVAGLAMVLVLAAPAAFAFAVPAVGTFGYDIYDTVINQILNGPIGFVGAAIAIIFGVVQLFRSWVLGIVALIVASMVANAETIVATLGYSI